MLEEIRLKQLVITGYSEKDIALRNKKAKQFLQKGWEDIGNYTFKKIVLIRKGK